MLLIANKSIFTTQNKWSQYWANINIKIHLEFLKWPWWSNEFMLKFSGLGIEQNCLLRYLPLNMINLLIHRFQSHKLKNVSFPSIVIQYLFMLVLFFLSCFMINICVPIYSVLRNLPIDPVILFIQLLNKQEKISVRYWMNSIVTISGHIRSVLFCFFLELKQFFVILK